MGGEQAIGEFLDQRLGKEDGSKPTGNASTGGSRGSAARVYEVRAYEGGDLDGHVGAGTRTQDMPLTTRPKFVVSAGGGDAAWGLPGHDFGDSEAAKAASSHILGHSHEMDKRQGHHAEPACMGGE